MKNNRAIILIFHHASRLKWFERISLQQCFRVLGQHPIRLVCPTGTDLTEYLELVPEIVADPIPPNRMSSLQRYNRMKIMPFIYRRYRQYQFMLTYELDAFVFRDELDDWCNRGFDYVGAPWFAKRSDPRATPLFAGVGNSGFSLRNIESALRIINSFGWVVGPVESAQRSIRRKQYGEAIAKVLALPFIRNNTHWSQNLLFRSHEDAFWSRAGQRRKWFRIADYESARRFSFEQEPAFLYELCQNGLPFGCHAWQKYELDFWRPHIEEFGYELPAAT